MKRILMAFLLAVCACSATFATTSGGYCTVKNGDGSAAYVNFSCTQIYVGLDYATDHDVVVLVEVTLEDGQSSTISLTIPANKSSVDYEVPSHNCVVSAKIASASCL